MEFWDRYPLGLHFKAWNYLRIIIFWKKLPNLYSPSLAKEAHEPVQTKLSSVFSWLTTFLAAWLGYAKLGPFRAFNNYVDQILPNFDRLSPSSKQFWTFYILFVLPSLDFLPTTYQWICHSYVILGMDIFTTGQLSQHFSFWHVTSLRVELRIQITARGWIFWTMIFYNLKKFIPRSF